MKTQLLDQTEKAYAVVLDKGDDVMTSLTAFVAAQGLTAGSFTAIGAFSAATLGFFDREKKDYDKITVAEQTEVLSCIGNIARDEAGEPKLHIHVVLGQRDGSTRGGHLLDATVWPTLELIVREEPAHLHRRSDPETGLPLIDAQPAPAAVPRTM